MIWLAEFADIQSVQPPFMFPPLAMGEDAFDFEARRGKYLHHLKQCFCQILQDSSISQDNVLFVFDEAHCLQSNLLLLRGALRFFPSRIGPCCPITVFTDTIAKISNLSPSRKSDPSLRVTDMPTDIFPPFYLLANVDVWVDKNDLPETLADMGNEKYCMRYGRPLWGALAKQGVIRAGEIIKLAITKILGGDSDAFESGQLTHDMSLAILGIRLCIDISPLSKVNYALVAQHMRALYYVSPDGEAAITGHFSEPVLVEAAARLTHFGPALSPRNRWKVLLEALVGSLKNGIVEAGFRGELAARILLLLAWDICCLKNFPNQSPVASCIFLFAVPLVQFLETLLHLDEETKRSLQDRFGKAEEMAWVRCTHFVKLHYTPNTAALLDLYRRGAVGITKYLQAGVDVLIPIVFCKDQTIKITEQKVSCAFLQIKNRQSCDGKNPGSVASGLTPNDMNIKLNDELQFLSLYMNLAPQLGPEQSEIERPDTVRQLRSREIGEKQMSLAVFTMSPTVYKVLDGDIIELMRQIGEIWIDPVALHSDDQWACKMVKAMLPCEHQEI